MIITTDDNHLIHYEALGRGRPLLLLHGWLGSWRYWWGTMQALSTQHRAFAFDMWGFGDSSKPNELYSFNFYLKMLEVFIEQLGIATPLTLVGHALGASVAVRFAAQRPDLVDGLVAVSLPVHGRFINERLATLAADDFMQRFLGKSKSYPEIDSEIRKIDQAAMNKLAMELSEENFSADLEQVNCKTLLIFGHDDPVIEPPSGAYAYLQQPERHRQCILLDRLAHFPMLEEKAKFNRLLTDFVHLNGSGSVQEIAVKDIWQRRTR